MDEPWKKYQPAAAQAEDGPWTKYQSTEIAPPATPAAKEEPVGFTGALARGFKRSLPETESLLYGAGAAAAGLAGADSLRDSALKNYQRVQRDDVQPLQGQATFKRVLSGDSSLGEYAGDVIGNFAGQGLQSAAVGAAGALAGGALGAPAAGVGAVPGAVVGGVGGLLARGAARKAITNSVEKLIAQQVAKGATRDAAEAAGSAMLRRRLGQLGGGAIASTGLNAAQEVGIGYTGRAEDAAAAGEPLTAGDAARAIGWGIPAGLVDTASEGLAVGRLLRGGNNAKLARRVLGGAAAGAATEGGTETVQAAMERAGAGQRLTGADAYNDYLENFAAGALGGAVLGGASGVRRRAAESQDQIPGQPEDTSNPSTPALPPPGPITVDAGGNAVTPGQEYQRQQGQFRRGYNGSQPIMDAEFTDVTPPPAPPADMLALPPPGGTDQTIDVAPDGTAFAPGQAAAQQEADAGLAQARAEVGLTPDVNRARARNPAAAPNALPDGSPLPDPGNGAISRAVNIAAGTGALQQAADQQATAQVAGRAAAPVGARPGRTAQANGMDPAYRDQLKALVHDYADMNGDVPDLKTLRSTYDLGQRDAAELRREVVIERNTVAPAPDRNSAATSPGVPTQITMGMRRDLIGRGYSADQIATLRPQQAWDILNAAPESATNATTIEGPIPQGPVANGAVDAGRNAVAPGAVAGDPAGQAEGAFAAAPPPIADAPAGPLSEPAGNSGALPDQAQASLPVAAAIPASGQAESLAPQAARAGQVDAVGMPGAEIPGTSVPAIDQQPATPLQGSVPAPAVQATPASPRRQAAKVAPSGKPMDLLRVIAANGGLDREDFRRQGVDPSEFGRRAGFHYIFRKRSKDGAARGMTLSDLREFMQQEGYLPQDSPDRPPEVDDNDALDLFDRAFRGGQEVYAPDQMDAVAALREQQNAQDDAYREEQTRAAGSPDTSGNAAQTDPFDPANWIESSFQELVDRALMLGATEQQIEEAALGANPDMALSRLITELETSDGQRTDQNQRDTTGAQEGTPPGRVPEEPRAGTGLGELPPEPGRPPGQSPAQEEVANSSPAQSGLFAAPTAREAVDGEARRRDAERDGRAGAGRTDMAAGDGELFAGPRPAQAQIPDGLPVQTFTTKDGAQARVAIAAGRSTNATDGDGYRVTMRLTNGSVVTPLRTIGAFDTLQEAQDAMDSEVDRLGGPVPKPDAGIEPARASTGDRPTASDNTVQLLEDGARYERTQGPVSTVGEGGGDAEAAVGARRGSGRAAPLRGQLDLFVHTPRQARAVSVEARQRYATEVKAVTTGVFRSGITQVNTWQDAAHIIAPLRKSAQEQVLALVVDGQGKPLRVIRHSIGGVDSAQVSTAPLLGAVSGTPGARAVYFAHNHPSGSISQSNADRNLTDKLHGLLQGSGIEARGMIVVAPQSSRASYYLPVAGEGSDRVTVANRSGAGSAAVPQVERHLRRSVVATDSAPVEPNTARKMVRNAVDSGAQSGLLLLNTKNQVIGTLPITASEMTRLRTGDPSSGTARVLSELERANASAAIIFGGDTAAQDNIAGMLKQVDIRVLDAFGVENDVVGESRAATGQTIGTSSWFSRPDRSLFNVVNQLKEGSRTPPQTRAQVTAAITGITSKWKGDRPRVVVLESAEGLPEHVKSDPAYRTAEGFYDQATRTAYLVAPNIRGGYDMKLKRQVTARERAQMVLAHEVIGHYAIEDITGPELWRQIGESVQRMRESGKQADLFAEVDRRNPRASQDTLLKETLAVMAEKGVRNGIMDRIAAAVRRFLRAMGFDLRFSDAELRQHIARAARHVEVSADANAPAAGQAGEAFPSRPDLDLRKQVPVVNMVGGVFGDPARDLKAVRARARDYLRKIRDAGRMMTNGDTGWKIGLSRDSIGELTNFDAGKINMLLALPRITKVAVLAESRDARQEQETGRGGRPSIRAFHILYAPVRINQDLRIVRLVVREDVNGHFAYDFQRSDVLEMLNPAPAGIPAIESGARQDTGSRVMTLAQLRDAVNAIDRPGWQWSQPGDQFRTDARGNPFVQRGNDRFVQRGDQWYLGDAAGRPADFLTRGAAQAAAQRTGGQVSADPNEGARRTWSVVLPDGAGVSRAASESLFSQPDSAREGQGLRDRMNARAQRIFDGVDKVMPGRREFPERMDEQQRAAAKKFATFAPKEKLADRYDRIKSKAADKLVQRLFDQFRPLRGLSPTAFMQAHLSKGTDGALEAAFKYGAPVLRDGAYAVDTRDGGIQAVLSKLQGEHETMLMWMVGNRAERLLAEGREHLFSADDIAALKRLADGKMPDGTDRATAYRAAMKEINRYNRAFLDIAEKAGVVNAESRKVWEDEFYIPFYREMEQGSNAGPGQVGLLRQRVIERLAGGNDTLGDPLENMLANWSHMLTASMRNMAANTALDQGVLAGIATSLEKPDKDSVWTMRDGKEAYWHVDDPMVLEALEALNFSGYDNPLMRQAGKFKRALTIGVTASPSFRVRNMLRDSLSALGTAEVGYNPLRNMVDGWKATGRDADSWLNLLAGGGTVRFGSFNDGDQAARAKRLISMGVNENQILDTKDKVRNAFRRLADQWQEIGDRAETVNRAVIYQRAIDAGKSHLEASFEARDLMNFTSMGSASAIRALTQVLPFFNARLQGVDRLVRGAKANPRRFAAVAGTVAMASALLYLLNSDDDDYKALPDYVRDTYWPIKLGGKWLYLPKPFEIGAMGTVIERMTELAVAGDDYQAKDFRNTLVSVLSSQLAMNPIPQIVRPVTEAAFNYDLFRMAPIDTAGQQNLLPQDRYTARTAAPAVVAGKLTGISPQRLEHMVGGYFGWLGIQALNAGDWAMRDAAGLPSNPNRDLTKTNNLFVLGDFVKEKGTASNKYLTRFYDIQGDIDQIYASASLARKSGDAERVQQLLQDPKMKLRPAFQAVDKQITRINQQIKQVNNSRELSAREKNDRLLRLNALRNEAAQRADRIARQQQ